MGADRAILIVAAADVHQDIEPLAVAKLLKAVVDAEQPGLVLCGKQAIDNDMNATGQMLAALLGWAQATFASEVSVEGDHAVVTREVDGGLQSVKVKLPAIVSGGPAAERAALRLAAEHHEGQEEAAGGEDARRLRRGRHAAAYGREDGGARDAEGGGAGGLGRRADREAQGRGGGALMAVLLLAEVTNGQLGTDAVAKAVTAVKSLGEVHVLVAGQGGDAAAAEAATLSGVAKVLFAGDHGFCHMLAEPTADLSWAGGGYSHIAAPATTDAKNILPRVAALLDVMVISEVTA
jgi:electron transfer flavoprotein alpha subunit